MVLIEVFPRAIGRADRALIVRGVDEEEGRSRVWRDRRQRQVEAWSAVSDIEDVACDLRIFPAIAEPFGNLQRPSFRFRYIRPVREVHVDQELVALAERKHLLRHAPKLRDRQRNEEETCAQDDDREADCRTHRRTVERLHPRIWFTFLSRLRSS